MQQKHENSESRTNGIGYIHEYGCSIDFHNNDGVLWVSVCFINNAASTEQSCLLCFIWLNFLLKCRFGAGSRNGPLFQCKWKEIICLCTLSIPTLNLAHPGISISSIECQRQVAVVLSFWCECRHQLPRKPISWGCSWWKRQKSLAPPSFKNDGPKWRQLQQKQWPSSMPELWCS